MRRSAFFGILKANTIIEVKYQNEERLMHNRCFVSRVISVLVVALAVGAAPAAQQDSPNRPIRLLTPAAPGGTTDFLARLFGAKLSDVFKQQLVVDNRGSAAGVIAGELTANATPDGYTLLLAYHQHTVNAALLSKLPYHPVNDFTPITQMTEGGLLLVVNPSHPAKKATELG